MDRNVIWTDLVESFGRPGRFVRPGLHEMIWNTERLMRRLRSHDGAEEEMGL